MKHFLALFRARNREFYRDRDSMAWTLLFPFVLIIGIGFASQGDRYAYQVGVVGTPPTELTQLPHLRAVPYDDLDQALLRLRQTQLNLVVQAGQGDAPTRYWLNEQDNGAWYLDRSIRDLLPAWQRQAVSGQVYSYAVWVVPGVLCMSLLFSCLYGTGYIIVRYRDQGVLKRLRATPITALEFLAAQAASRLLITVATLAMVFTAAWWWLDFPLQGSPWLLLLIAAAGSLTMIGVSLICAARTDSMEFMNGLVGLVSWPMMFVSGLWFSLDNSPVWLQALSQVMPLTHIVEAARAVMLNGAGLADIQGHLWVLLVMAVATMSLAATLFRWTRTSGR